MKSIPITGIYHIKNEDEKDSINKKEECFIKIELDSKNFSVERNEQSKKGKTLEEESLLDVNSGKISIEQFEEINLLSSDNVENSIEIKDKFLEPVQEKYLLISDDDENAPEIKEKFLNILGKKRNIIRKNDKVFLPKNNNKKSRSNQGNSNKFIDSSPCPENNSTIINIKSSDNSNFNYKNNIRSMLVSVSKDELINSIPSKKNENENESWLMIKNNYPCTFKIQAPIYFSFCKQNNSNYYKNKTKRNGKGNCANDGCEKKDNELKIDNAGFLQINGDYSFFSKVELSQSYQNYYESISDENNI